jgi:hypothetical protein
MNITNVKSASQNSRSAGLLSVERALGFIKGEKNFHIDKIERARKLGKYDQDCRYSVFRYGKKTEANYYEYVKSTSVPCFCWSLSLEEGRVKRKVNIKQEDFSGFIYFDIDKSSEDVSIEEIKQCLFKLPYIKAVWKSFGGKGLGILAQCDGIGLQTWDATWHILFDKITEEGIRAFGKGAFELDPVTKDYTRINIGSYDPEIFIKSEKDVTPFKAVSEYTFVDTKSGRASIKKYDPIYSSSFQNSEGDEITIGTGDEMTNRMQAESFIHLSISDESFTSNYNGGKRLSYNFYQIYFSKCNLYGIPLEDSYQSLLSYKDKNPDCMLFIYRDRADVYDIGASQYKSYETQFGIKLANIVADWGGIVGVNQKFDYHPAEVEMLVDLLVGGNRGKLGFFIDKICEQAKKIGISFSALTSCLSQKTKKDVFLSCKKIYSDARIPQGIVFKNKNEGIGTSLYANKTMQEGDRADVLRAVIKDGAADVQKIKNEAEALYGTELSERATEVLQMFKEEFKGDAPSVLRDDVKGVEYVLKKGQYISDLNLTLGKKTLIYADTNAGKTTWVMKGIDRKLIFLAPTINLTISAAKKHKDAIPFFRGKKIDKVPQKIACTYNSLPRLISELGAKGEVVSDWGLVVDEAHKYVTSSSKNFMLENLRKTIEMLDIFDFVVFMTGTWLPLLHPATEGFAHIRVTKENPVKYKIISCKKKYVAIEKRCEKGGKNYIFLQSKQAEKQLGTYIRYFTKKGWDRNNILIVNSDTREHSDSQYLFENNKSPENAEIIIFTSIMSEGTDILGENASTLHFASNCHPADMQQIANRFRDCLPGSVFIYAQEKKEGAKRGRFSSLLEEQRNLIAHAEELMNCASECSRKSLNLFSTSDIFYFDDSSRRYKIDYLYIANLAFKKEVAHCYADFDAMKNYLKGKYKWVNMGDEYDDGDMTKQEKQDLSEYKKGLGEAINETKAGIVGRIIELSEEEAAQPITIEMSEKIKSESSLPEFELTARYKFAYLIKNMEIEDARKILNEWVCSGASETAWKIMKGQIKIRNAEKKIPDSLGSIEDALFKEIKRRIENNKNNENPALFEKSLIKLASEGGEELGVDEAIEKMERYVSVGVYTDARGIKRYTFGQVKVAMENAYLIKKIKELCVAIHAKGFAIPIASIKNTFVRFFKNTIYHSKMLKGIALSTKKTKEILSFFCDFETTRGGKIIINSPTPKLFEMVSMKGAEEESAVLLPI